MTRSDDSDRHGTAHSSAIAVQPETRPSPPIAERPPTTARWWTLGWLGAILVLALGLRLWGLTWVPASGFHPDEVLYAPAAERMLATGDPNPRYFQNPSLFTYLIAGELLLARALGPLATPLGPDPSESAFRLARLDSALLGTASVGLVFAAGATLFDRRVGLVAALFLAVSFLHVRNSHYGVNDVPSTALLLLSLYFDARLLRQPALRWYALAGLAGGLATSTKYSMGFFFVPLLAAHWLARESAGRAPARGLVLAAASSLVGYLLGTPYTVLDFGRFSADFAEQNRLGNAPWWGQPSEPVPLQYLTALLQGFGALPLALALVGLVLAWRRRRPEAILLHVFPLVYLVSMLTKALFFPRFALPLLPFCALLAGYGAIQLIDRFSPPWRGAGLAILLAAALAQPLANDVLHNRLLLRADTRVLANEWIRANLPPGSRLIVEDGSFCGRRAPTGRPGDGRASAACGGPSRRPAPARSSRSTSGRPPWVVSPEMSIESDSDRPAGESLARMAARGVQYVVISSFIYGRDEEVKEYRRLHRSLEQEAELIARFSPGVGGREVPFRHDDVYSPLWSLGEYERPGPTIRIYSLAPLMTGSR